MPKPLRAARRGCPAVQTKKLRKVCAFRSFLYILKRLGFGGLLPDGNQTADPDEARGTHRAGVVPVRQCRAGNAADSPHLEPAVRADVERQHVARVQVAGEDGLRQQRFGLALEIALERPRAVDGVIAVVGDQLARRGRDLPAKGDFSASLARRSAMSRSMMAEMFSRVSGL